MLKKVLVALLVVFIVIQFIRPGRNNSAASANDIGNHYAIPGDVQATLKRACYDCHSNNTTYPWYSNIQPFGWWLNNHIEEGKEELNFSEFATYKPKRQAHKLEEVAELTEEGEMPLESYTLIHRNAILKMEEKKAVVTWAKALQKQIENENNLVEN